MKNSFKTTFLHSLTLLLLAAFCLHGQAYADDTARSSSKYEGTSLCDAGDEIYQACTTQSGKTLSICSTTKQKSNIMYLVYGTPGRILVSSPKIGDLPLKYSHMGMADYSFYFTDNENYYIQYETSDVRDSFDQSGFIIEDKSDHKVIINDMCKNDLNISKIYNNSNNYIDRQRKSSSYNNNIDGNYYDLLNIMNETADQKN